VTVLLPDLAEYAKSQQWEIYNRRLISAMNIIALITIPITFFSMAQGQGLIRLLFQTRSFDEESVRLTLAAFTFHMPGLYFIAMNRVLAPAFYAQSNTKSPTLAGIISFVINMTLAALLVFHFKGAGIALALSIASAANTAALLVFLYKNPAITLGKTLKSALGYALKLVLFSAAALIPIVFLSPWLTEFFIGRGRFISHGAPLVINALVYAGTGLTLLAVTRDKQLLGIMKMLSKN
jgi:putative peptidoglycan lipid II flippase